MTRLLWLVSIALVAGGTVHAADEKPKVDPQKVFEKLDTDKDGKLTSAEFGKISEIFKMLKPQAIEFAWKKLDADGNGALSSEEFAKLVDLFKKQK